MAPSQSDKDRCPHCGQIIVWATTRTSPGVEVGKCGCPMRAYVRKRRPRGKPDHKR